MFKTPPGGRAGEEDREEMEELQARLQALEIQAKEAENKLDRERKARKEAEKNLAAQFETSKGLRSVIEKMRTDDEGQKEPEKSKPTAPTFQTSTDQTGGETADELGEDALGGAGQTGQSAARGSDSPPRSTTHRTRDDEEKRRQRRKKRGSYMLRLGGFLPYTKGNDDPDDDPSSDGSSSYDNQDSPPRRSAPPPPGGDRPEVSPNDNKLLQLMSGQTAKVPASLYNAIPIFRGEADDDPIEQFITSVESIKLALKWDDEFTAFLVHRKLQKSAATWLRSAILMMRGDERLMWWSDGRLENNTRFTGLRSALLKRFTTCTKRAAAEAVRNLKLSNGESVSHFYDRCVEAIDKSHWHEKDRHSRTYQKLVRKQLFDYFSNGLPDEIALHALGGPHPPTTAEDLLIAARNVELECASRARPQLLALQSDATVSTVRGATGRANVPPGACFKCGRFGHFQNACTQGGSGGKRPEAGSSPTAATLAKSGGSGSSSSGSSKSKRKRQKQQQKAAAREARITKLEEMIAGTVDRINSRTVTMDDEGWAFLTSDKKKGN